MTQAARGYLSVNFTTWPSRACRQHHLLHPPRPHPSRLPLRPRPGCSYTAAGYQAQPPSLPSPWRARERTSSSTTRSAAPATAGRGDPLRACPSTATRVVRLSKKRRLLQYVGSPLPTSPQLTAPGLRTAPPDRVREEEGQLHNAHNMDPCHDCRLLLGPRRGSSLHNHHRHGSPGHIL